MHRATIILFVAALIAGCGGRVNRIDAYNDYAILAAQRGLWKEAAFRWEQALEEGDDARLWNNLGVAYEASERFDDALAAYDRAITLDPDNPHYMRNLRRAQRNKKRVDEAPPTDPNAWTEDDMRDDQFWDETERRPDALPY